MVDRAPLVYVSRYVCNNILIFSSVVVGQSGYGSGLRNERLGVQAKALFKFNQIFVRNHPITHCQLCDLLTAKFNHVWIIISCKLLCCNLITSLLPHPGFGCGTNRLGTRLLDHLCTCTEISKKLILYRPCWRRIQIFFTLNMVLSLEIFD